MMELRKVAYLQMDTKTTKLYKMNSQIRRNKSENAAGKLLSIFVRELDQKDSRWDH